MLVITMALMSVILKTYNEPIFANFALSVVTSVGTFIISLAISAVFLILVNSQQFSLIYLINLVIYTVFFLGAYRMVAHFGRRLNSFVLIRSKKCDMQRVIIMGAGDAGKYLADMLKSDKSKAMYPVCFIDDDPELNGKLIKGLKVEGNRALIPFAAQKVQGGRYHHRHPVRGQLHDPRYLQVVRRRKLQRQAVRQHDNLYRKRFVKGDDK